MRRQRGPEMTPHGGRSLRASRNRFGAGSVRTERIKLNPSGEADVKERPVIHAPTAFEVVQHAQLRDLSPP
jgi:hypothetical protein